MKKKNRLCEFSYTINLGFLNYPECVYIYTEIIIS